MRLTAIVPGLAFAMLLAGACGEATPAPALLQGGSPTPGTRESAGPLVLFLGDSLSAGLNLPAEQAFPAVLQRQLAAEGVPSRLINAGVSGDTTAGGLRRLDWLLKQRPDWVVVELGGNDGLRGLPLESIEQNLRAIVERARAGGARVLLLGLCLPANYGRDYGQRFEALYARLAEELELPFVPCFLEGVGGVAELNFSDGIHPTAEGHVKLAEKLAPVLRELLLP
jgi:acyl-CoA thioesterase-1